MEQRLTEAIIANLEDEIDASEGLKALVDTQGTKPLDEYLNSLKK